jgi:histidinol phosphatase-like PHP family hydrolase
VSLSNAELSTLLRRAAADEEGHRRRALERAAKDAWRWDEEVAAVAASGRPLTEIRSVGPWIAARLEGWLLDPPAEIPEDDPTRRGFLTWAEARAVLAADPSWETAPHGDLQLHTTDSDGRLPLPEMAAAARVAGRAYIAVTDHSESLRVAGGQTVEELRDQGRRIAALNAEATDGFRILRSIEMDIVAEGEGDMDPAALAELDLVLGAFHTGLRSPVDATERYLAALRNPDVHVLAHPTTRMFDRRVGLVADWARVFAEAARLGKAVEIDATPRRQDLPVDLARIAVAEGVRWFSIGSDAHAAEELVNLPIGFAIAALAGVPRERILNYRTPDEIIAWARGLRPD